MSNDRIFCIVMMIICLLAYVAFRLIDDEIGYSAMVICVQIYVVGGLVIGKLDELLIDDSGDK